MPSAPDPRPARYLEVRTELLARTAATLARAAQPPGPSLLRDSIPAGSPYLVDRGRVYTSQHVRRRRRRARWARFGRWAYAAALLLARGLAAAAFVFVVLALMLAGMAGLAGLLILAATLAALAATR